MMRFEFRAMYGIQCPKDASSEWKTCANDVCRAASMRARPGSDM